METSEVEVKSKNLVRPSPKQLNQLSSKATLGNLFHKTGIRLECYAAVQN